MELILYNNNSDENVINKEYVENDRFTINIKNITDVINPDIPLRLNDVDVIQNSNYVYVTEFERFYFIRSIQNQNKNIWILNLECDVLESFKDDILNSNAELFRGIKEGDYQMTNLSHEVRKEVLKYDSDVELDDESPLILSAVTGVE